jgi:nucleotidyltransferase substrate binding protein (TIGR01987 family)
MDYLEEKFPVLKKALKALSESLEAPKSMMSRDAALKRFEFTFELFWKTIKAYLKEIEKIDCFSPASCMREMRRPFNVEDSVIEICLSMGEDRNLSVHTYSEEMANELYEKLPAYLETMKIIADKIKKKAGL